MSIVFRVAFNNQGWSGKCKNALNDVRLFKCRDMIIDVGYGKFTADDQGTCTSGCWEATLCSTFIWYNVQNNFNKIKAHGEAYFVYPKNGSLVFLGQSRIKNIIDKEIYFEPFSPLPVDKQVYNLRASDFLGVLWGNGTYRYLDEQQESKLKQLLGRVNLPNPGQDNDFDMQDRTSYTAPTKIISAHRIGKQLMKNVEMTVEGNILTIKVDLTKEFGPSSSGKTIIIASTEGNISISDSLEAKIGLNVYKKKPA